LRLFESDTHLTPQARGTAVNLPWYESPRFGLLERCLIESVESARSNDPRADHFSGFIDEHSDYRSPFFAGNPRRTRRYG
jgi:hypothetical protein